jgi:hypothetical protein
MGLMDFDKAYKVILIVIFLTIIALLMYIMPIAIQERDLYGKCDTKILCKMGKINKMYCSNETDYNFNISIPKI